MQSYAVSRRWDAFFFVAAGLIGVGAAIIAIPLHQADADLILIFIAGTVLGFCRPHAAWRWALALALWIPLAGVLQLTIPPEGSAASWCGLQLPPPMSPFVRSAILFGLAFVAVYLGVAADAIVSWILARVPALAAAWTKPVKPVLRAGSALLVISIVLYAALSLAQPLQPYALGERYCWDEYCFSTQSVHRVHSLRAAGMTATAHGVFYVVSARIDTPWWGRFVWGPDAAFVVDYSGTEYRYAKGAQRIADASNRHASGCRVIPGASERETLVFDLPQNVVQPRLLVRDTLGLSGLLGGWRATLFYVKPAFNLRYD